MTDYVISCDTFVRLAGIVENASDELDDWFKTVRIDNGQAVATNRMIMGIENIGGPAGIIHVLVDPNLMAQCRMEAAFGSKLTITVMDGVNYATAKTTLGYVYPGNCVLWKVANDLPNPFDRWRSIVEECRIPAPVSRGGMFWDANMIARLAASSPSGRVIFEETIDAAGRPTIIRDVTEYDWLGIFQPYERGLGFAAATLPTWMVAK